LTSDDFFKVSSRPTGLSFYCKQCGSRRTKESHRKTQEKNRSEFTKRIHRNRALAQYGEKECSICGEVKKLVMFPGAHGFCKKCRNEKDRVERKIKGLKRGRRKTVSFAQGKLRNCISTNMRMALKEGKGGRNWEILVGYTVRELMKHLEGQFSEGMTWDNQGEWHVDHKIPVSAFNFGTPDDIDFQNCWALENLQPLWANENRKKNAKLVAPFQPSLLLSIKR